MNALDTREAWLREATNRLRTRFASVGADLPSNVRFAVAFPSSGRKGRTIGECWDASASADATFEIIIRADQSDPIDVLAILIHELTHSAVGLKAGHGKAFKRLALGVGLAGPMRSTHAGPDLLAHLLELAEALGPLPHAKLGFGLSNRPPKQDARMLKVECEICGYVCRVTRKWLEQAGPPHCPSNHGAMACAAVEKPEEAESQLTEETMLLAACKGK